MLSFWLDNTTTGFGQRFQASWNGSSLYNITNSPAFSWANLQFIVITLSSSTVLQFGAENDAAYFGLDDISVTHIPTVAFKTTTQTTGTFNLTWVTATDLVYQVQYKTNLLQPSWLNLIKPTTATTANLSAS